MSLLPRPSRPSRSLLPTLLSFLTTALAGFASQAVSVRWTANPETDISHYRVLYGTSATSLSQAVDAGNTTSAVIGGLANDTTYHFALQAVNTADMESETSTVVSYRTGPAAPASAPELVITDATGKELPSGDAALEFGAVQLGAPSSLTLTIGNSGNAVLSGIAATLSGPHAGDFSIAQAPAANVAAGGQTALRISFYPTAAGTRSATLTILSNDEDENPFVITLSGTGTVPPPTPQPNIAVEMGGSALVSGGATLNFGSVTQGSSSTATTITVRNTGNATLSGLSAAISGSHAGDFALQSYVPQSLAAGGSVSLSIVFRPSATGGRGAALAIASNDPDEGDFVVQLTGTGLAVPAPNIVVETGGGALVPGSALLNLGSVTQGSSSTATTITVRNTGNATLGGLSAAISGSHAGDFALQSYVPQSLAAGGSVSLSIVFRPSATGGRGAALAIASNDPDEGNFVVQLTGTGLAVPAPEIVVENNGSNLVDGSSALSFGSVVPGTTSPVLTLTVRNIGSAPLTGIATSLAGSHAADFLVSSPVISLAAGASTTFTVRFRPTAIGARSGQLMIASNDADENPFDIALGGTGLAVPEIDIFGPDGTPFASGSSSLAFGETAVRGSRALAVTIRNTGSAMLGGIAASVTGPQAAEFEIESAPPVSLAPGAETVLPIVFRPAAEGTRSATLRISSNDADEGNFTIALGGAGTIAPQISVFRVVRTAAMSGPVPDEVPVGSRGPGITYAIYNAGTAPLSQLALGFAGSHPDDFHVTPLDATELAPGESVEFTLSFAPRHVGGREAVLQIFSNDPYHNPLELPVSGTGIGVADIQIVSPNGGTIDFGSAKTGAKGQERSFLIRNSGSGAVENLRIVREGVAQRDFLLLGDPPRSIAPGAETTVRVRFQPSAAGTREASLRILSDNTKPAVLQLKGRGTATPRLRISTGRRILGNGDAYLSFGSQGLRSKGKAQTVTITNTGGAPLTGLAIRKDWLHAGDFKVTKPRATTLAPGKSVTVKVTFRPSAKGNRWAAIHIASREIPSFEILLNGVGVPSKSPGKKQPKKKLATRTTVDPQHATQKKMVVHVNGERYRALQIRKTGNPAVRTRDIQVSGDLLDWSSGPRHTTVVKEDERLLIVRDNTPLREGKRHIRLNPRR